MQAGASNWLERGGGRHLLGLGPLEAEILGVVWDHQPATVRDVYEELRKERVIAYTTVMSVLGNLAQKGLLDQDRRATAYRYRAALSELEVTHAILDAPVPDTRAG